MMRTGPGQNYPGTWLYVRRDLPIRVVEVYRNWRKIQDPDGTTGWMLVSLLSDQRTAIVRGDEPRPMHEAPDAASPVRFRAEPGVVGRVSRCAGGWCNFDVARPRRLHPDRPDLGRRAQRDDPLMSLAHAPAHDRRFLEPGRQDLRRRRSGGPICR